LIVEIAVNVLLMGTGALLQAAKFVNNMIKTSKVGSAVARTASKVAFAAKNMISSAKHGKHIKAGDAAKGATRNADNVKQVAKDVDASKKLKDTREVKPTAKTETPPVSNIHLLPDEEVIKEVLKVFNNSKKKETIKEGIDGLLGKLDEVGKMIDETIFQNLSKTKQNEAMQKLWDSIKDDVLIVLQKHPNWKTGMSREDIMEWDIKISNAIKEGLIKFKWPPGGTVPYISGASPEELGSIFNKMNRDKELTRQLILNNANQNVMKSNPNLRNPVFEDFFQGGADRGGTTPNDLIQHNSSPRYPPLSEYYVYATSAEAKTSNQEEEEKAKAVRDKMDMSGITLKDVVNVVSSREQECDLIFIQSPRHIHLCFKKQDNSYKLKPLFDTGSDDIIILDTVCSGDGHRVYILLNSPKILTALNTGSKEDPVFNFIEIL
jgi:hypothetical protein